MGSASIKCGKCNLSSTTKYTISAPEEHKSNLGVMFPDGYKLGIYTREIDTIGTYRSYRREVRVAETQVYRCDNHPVKTSNLHREWELSEECS